MKKLFATAIVGLLCYATAAIAAVNVNSATADQLETLDGIGSVKAEAIVADRKANGKYDTLDQLTRVNGIGNKTVEDLRSEASVGDNNDSADSGS